MKLITVLMKFNVQNIQSEMIHAMKYALREDWTKVNKTVLLFLSNQNELLCRNFIMSGKPNYLSLHQDHMLQLKECLKANLKNNHEIDEVKIELAAHSAINTLDDAMKLEFVRQTLTTYKN
jgi:hypothetical protein